MADYYPLLAKAVAGLPNSTAESRQAIYGRARGALLAQLRSTTPAVPEKDIERESKALDDAVRRLERELIATPSQPRPGRAALPPPASAEKRPTPPPGFVPRPAPAAPERPVLPARPAAASDDPAPILSAPAPRPRTESRRAPLAMPAAKPLQPGNGAEQTVRNGVPAPDMVPPQQQGLRVGRSKGDVAHPAAPLASRERPNRARFWIVFFTIFIVVGVIGVTAYLLRDRPEDLAHLRVAPAQATTPDAGSGKITGRADKPQAEPTNPVPTVTVATVPIRPPGAPNPSGNATPAPAPSEPPPPPAAQPAATVPATAPPAPAEPAPAQPAPAAAAPAAPAAAPTTEASSTIPVAYRAALLVEEPGNQEQNVKTYIGTVVWRTENTNTEGQPLSVQVHADIDIPDAKLKGSMILKKNTDPAFQASHTMVVGFVFAPGSELKGVKQIKLPQMRDEDKPGGDALVSVGVVPIIDNFFLVGLAQGDANVTQNLTLIQTRGWFDVPLELASGRLAKVTFEKGVQGDRAIKDAIASWK